MVKRQLKCIVMRWFLQVVVYNESRIHICCHMYFRETIDSVKQSAALCLLRLIRTSPDAIAMCEWSSRIIHLLNDQHMVSVPLVIMISV